MKNRGWKGIAAALGCSERKAKQLAYRPKGHSPLPVARDPLGIFVGDEELREWLAKETKRLVEVEPIAAA